MRCHSDLPLRPQPPAVVALGALRQIQSRLAALVAPASRHADVPLARATGRVLAQDLSERPAPAPPRIEAGTRLTAQHLPLFAGAGIATASVFARARVGVIALPDETSPATEASTGRSIGALASAAWIAATLDRLGVQPFEAVCRAPEPRRLLETLEMFVDKCGLVVTAGFLSPALCEAVRSAQAARGQPEAIETLRARPFGALQLMQVGTTLVVAMSADLESAVTAFTTLLTPLIRRLQGRAHPLPDLRAAELHDLWQPEQARWRPFPARLDTGALTARAVVRPCHRDDPALALAAADGLAWHAAEFAGFERPTVAWFPFDDVTR